MTKLKLVFNCGECNGFMTIKLYANNSLLIAPHQVDSPIYVVDTQVEFPLDLRIEVSGKNLNTDTLVENGKIVKDKYIQLKEIYLSRYPVKDTVIHSLCCFTPEGKQPENNTYFYCDGVARLQFQASNALCWHLSNNRY